MAWTNPRTWATNDGLTASTLNTHLRDNLLHLYGTAWTSWTPTLANLTLGNGTRVAVYQQIGQTVRWRFKFTLGSTSAVGSSPTFTLPVAPHADYALNAHMGMLSAHDTGTAVHIGGLLKTATASTVTLVNQSSPTAAYTATVPFTWTTGDQIYAWGEYEAA